MIGNLQEDDHYCNETGTRLIAATSSWDAANECLPVFIVVVGVPGRRKTPAKPKTPRSSRWLVGVRAGGAGNTGSLPASTPGPPLPGECRCLKTQPWLWQQLLRST